MLATAALALKLPAMPLEHRMRIRCAPPRMTTEDAKTAWLRKLNEVALEAIDFGVEVVAIDRNQVDSNGVRFGVTALHAVDIAQEVENADIVEVDLTPEIVQPVPSVTEEEAKQAWLAKLEVPTWGQALNDEQEMPLVEDVQEESDSTFESAAEQLLDEEEAAKQAWLQKLDTPTFGPASSNAAAAAQKKDQQLFEKVKAALPLDIKEVKCIGDVVASERLSPELEAKLAWMTEGYPPFGNRHRHRADMRAAQRAERKHPYE